MSFFVAFSVVSSLFSRRLFGSLLFLFLPAISSHSSLSVASPRDDAKERVEERLPDIPKVGQFALSALVSFFFTLSLVSSLYPFGSTGQKKKTWLPWTHYISLQIFNPFLDTFFASSHGEATGKNGWSEEARRKREKTTEKNLARKG